jgi:hypothetical protein
MLRCDRNCAVAAAALLFSVAAQASTLCDADTTGSGATFNMSIHYDGRGIQADAAKVQNQGREVCWLHGGKCSPYLDDSGVIYDAFLWGEPTGVLAPGMTWK